MWMSVSVYVCIIIIKQKRSIIEKCFSLSIILKMFWQRMKQFLDQFATDETEVKALGSVIECSIVEAESMRFSVTIDEKLTVRFYSIFFFYYYKALS